MSVSKVVTVYVGIRLLVPVPQAKNNWFIRFPSGNWV
jgi:hypothetical protein